MNQTIAPANQVPPRMEDEDDGQLLEIIGNVVFYKWIYLATLAVITAACVVYVLLTTPIYMADAMVQIDDKKAAVTVKALDDATKSLSSSSPVIGEIEIIQSRSVLSRTIELLGTNIVVSVNNRVPLVGNWLARVLPKDKNGFAAGLWESSRFAWGGEKLEISSATVPDKLYTKPFYLNIGSKNSWELLNEDQVPIAAGSSFDKPIVAMGGDVTFKVKTVKALPGTVFKIAVFSMQSEIDRLRVSLKVVEAKKASNIVSLTLENPSAISAAEILNTIVETYIKQNADRKSEETERTLKFLAGELPRLKRTLEVAEVGLNRFRSESHSVNIDDESQELLKLSTTIEGRQLDLQMKRRELAQSFTNEHPSIKAIDSELIVLNREAETISNKINLLPSVQQELLRLQRDVDVSNDLYVSLLNTVQELQIAKAGQFGNATLIDRALVPEFPKRPQKSVIVMLGFVLGNLFGFLFAQMAAYFSKTIRDPRKFESDIKLPVLAIVPTDVNQSKVAKGGPGPFLLAREFPDSDVAESLSNLRTSIIFALSEKPRSKVILITSAVPNQGKTFISSNLACLMAATGKKVLMIDGDIRRSSLFKYFKVSKSQKGFTDSIQNPDLLNELIIRNAAKNLDVLPAGSKVGNSLDLFVTGRLESLIGILVNQYDYIVIDSCPVLSVQGTRLLSKASDLTLFVVRQGDVNLGQIHETMDIFGKAGASLDGFIFNFYKASKLHLGYTHGYSYRNYRYTSN